MLMMQLESCRAEPEIVASKLHVLPDRLLVHALRVEDHFLRNQSVRINSR